MEKRSSTKINLCALVKQFAETSKNVSPSLSLLKSVRFLSLVRKNQLLVSLFSLKKDETFFS